jgi:lantibiotic modifying enzyme
MICSWCHGAPGVGFSRLSALEVMEAADKAAVAADLRIALDTTMLHPLGGQDGLCCGNFGRIDLLLEAGRRLGIPVLEDAAHRRAAARIEHAGDGEFDLPHPTEDGRHAIGLWQGPAGVGYALLRLAMPEQFPCLLLWQ